MSWLLEAGERLELSTFTLWGWLTTYCHIPHYIKVILIPQPKSQSLWQPVEPSAVLCPWCFSVSTRALIYRPQCRYLLNYLRCWWAGLDSNQRIPKEADLQSAAIAAMRPTHITHFLLASAPAAFWCQQHHWTSTVLVGLVVFTPSHQGTNLNLPFIRWLLCFKLCDIILVSFCLVVYN